MAKHAIAGASEGLAGEPVVLLRVADQVETGLLLGDPSLDRRQQRVQRLGLQAAEIEPCMLTPDTDVGIPDQGTILLGDQDVVGEFDVGRLPVLLKLRDGCAVRPMDAARKLVQELGYGLELLRLRRPHADFRGHAGTSCSSVSGSPARSDSSRSGSGFACSPSRLIQTERSPSSRAGAMSWKRLAAT